MEKGNRNHRRFCIFSSMNAILLPPGQRAIHSQWAVEKTCAPPGRVGHGGLPVGWTTDSILSGGG